MKDYKICMALIIQLLCCSCTSSPPLENIKENEIIHKYEGFQVAPFRGDVRMVTTPSNFTIMFKHKGDKLTLLDEKLDTDSVRTFLSRLVQDFNKNKIIALISDSSSSLILTSYADSSYQDIIRNNPTYIDQDASQKSTSKLDYRLCYVYTKNLKGKSNVLDRVKGKNIYKIDSNWYYYRSFDFAQVKSF